MEKEIKKLLEETASEKIPFWHLVVVKETEDEEEAPLCVNEVALEGGKVVCYDRDDEDSDGTIEPIWKMTDLSEETQKELLWAIKNTRMPLCA